MSTLRNNQQRVDFTTKRWNFVSQSPDLDFWTLNNTNDVFNVCHFGGKWAFKGSYFFDMGDVEVVTVKIPESTSGSAPFESVYDINCAFYPIIEDFDKDVFSVLTLGPLIATRNIFTSRFFSNALPVTNDNLETLLSFAFELQFPIVTKCYGLKGIVDFADLSHSPIFASTPFFRHMRNV